MEVKAGQVRLLIFETLYSLAVQTVNSQRCYCAAIISLFPKIQFFFIYWQNNCNRTKKLFRDTWQKHPKPDPVRHFCSSCQQFWILRVILMEILVCIETSSLKSGSKFTKAIVFIIEEDKFQIDINMHFSDLGLRNKLFNKQVSKYY